MTPHELDNLLTGLDPERAEQVVRAYARATYVDRTLERAVTSALDTIRRTGNLSVAVDILGRALRRAELASIEPTPTEGSTKP